MQKIFISCGDVSGDLHAAYLVKALLEQSSDISIAAIGGEKLKNSGVKFFENIVNFQGFGFNGILKKYFYFKNVLNKIVKPYFENENPDLVVIVDFYGFNIHIARLAKRFGIRVIYYISPQVWASRGYRINVIKKYVDEVIPIFPFETELYKKYGVSTFYYGNPLIDIIGENEEDIDIYQKFNIEKSKTLIGIMPGSRREEVARILPVMLESIKDLDKDVRFFLFISNSIDQDMVIKMLESYAVKNIIHIINGPSYNIRKKLKFTLTSSGTVTVENTILDLPMLIFYKMPNITYQIAKRIIKIKFIGMPNILANKLIIPEYIQTIDLKEVAATINKWTKEDKYTLNIKQELKDISKRLGEKGILNKIAAHILNRIKN